MESWLVSSVILTIAAGVVTFLVKLFKARKFFRNLQRLGLPMPPHHPIFGHIALLAGILRNLPPDAHISLFPNEVRRQYPHLDTAFYLDLWPFGPPMLVALSPDIISQFTQERSLPKFKDLRQFIRPITGGHDLLTMEGAVWRRWRSIFNPGFSAQNVMSLVPEILKNVLVFRDIIKGHAEKGDIFQLEELALNLSNDITGRVVLSHDFNSQRAFNDMTSALRMQLKWCNSGVGANLLQNVNIVCPLVHCYNTYRMNRYLSRILNYDGTATISTTVKSKSIFGLALSSHPTDEIIGKEIASDATFKEVVMGQIKLFLLAGSDTTAASLVYTLHLIFRHPDTLSRLRSEHTAIFGSDPSDSPNLLSSEPHLLNQLPFTLAVIKEALRLFPAATTARQGQPGFYLVDQIGLQLPTEHCLVWSNHHSLHHNPRYWSRAEEFLPERWLVPEGHELYPIKNAWRPFERGLRSCLGQELALTNIKLSLVLLLREFDFVDAYEIWDSLRGRVKRARVNGERVYQTSKGGGGHPSDFYPCKANFVRKENG
jgi:sterigmatocystin biosynthesis cytochrome P450 monooxygenase